MNRATDSLAKTNGGTGNRAATYDSRGNVDRLGGQYFSYDATNRPSSMTGDVEATYRYDGHGRRVRSVVWKDTGYVVRYNVYGASGDLIFNVQIDRTEGTDHYVTTMVKMDGQSIARVKSTGRVWNYTDEVTYLHNDHLGSAGSGTLADGTIAWREEYSPFGLTMQNDASNDNQAGYTGHIKDSDTGLNYMQARYYDPVIGRFLSVDPVGFLDTQNPSFFNRYRYCSNDPVNCTDPTGQSDLFKKFFDFGASDAAATASRSMESFATSEGMNPNGATDMMNDVLAAGAIGQLEGMANGAANIVDIAGNEIMSSAMDGDNCWGGYRSCDFNGACTNSWKEAGW